MSNFASVVLDGKPFLIEVPSYRVRDLVDFSPRASTAGGSIIHSELGLYQLVSQASWAHGFGFPWWITESGYEVTEGNMDTRHPGLAMLFTAPVNATITRTGSGAGQISGFARFDAAPANKLYAWNDSTYWYSINGLSWTGPNATPGAVQFMWDGGTYLFASIQAGRIMRSPTGAPASWVAAGANASSTDYAWIGNHDGFVYAGKRLNNQVYYATEEDLSDLYGIPGDDPNVIYVGKRGGRTRGFFSFMGSPYVVTASSIYRIEREQLAAIKVLDFSNEVKVDGFRRGRWAIYHSQLIISTGDAVYQWNGVRLADITPSRRNGIYPFVSYGGFGRMFVVKTDLFMYAKRSEDNTWDLLCWDGSAWHILMNNVGTQTPSASFYDPPTQRYFYDVAANLRYFQLNEYNRFISQNFPTAGNHTLITSRIDAGFRRVIKSTPNILVEAYNLTSDRYIDVDYRLDSNQDWIPWGGTDGVTNRVNTDGVTELVAREDRFVGDRIGEIKPTVEYKHIQFRFRFVTDVHDQSPILENFIIRLIMRPDTNFGYGFNVVVARYSDLHAGVVDDRNPAQILADLKKIRDKKEPVEFFDIYGQKTQVYISALSEQAVEWHSDRPGAHPMVESRCYVNLVSVEHGSKALEPMAR